MRKFLSVYILLLIMFFAEYSIAQNLVPNPSFETYTTCPVATSEITVATPWAQPTAGTSDYFNVCNQSPFPFPIPVPGLAPVGVPSNSFGYQQAHTDSAYAGFISVGGPSDDGEREYVRVALSSPLAEGEDYCVRFYVSLADNASVATNGIGAMLSRNPSYVSTTGTIPGIAQVMSTNVIDEKIDWVEISGNFIALEPYTHVTIGNLKPAGATTVATSIAPADTISGGFPPTPLPLAYYYMDDVYVGSGVCPNLCGVSSNSNVTLETCGMADASAWVDVNGGSGNYTYLWSNGATNDSISGLAHGVHSVTITDLQGGCDVVQHVLIKQDTDLEIAVNSTDVNCQSNGSAEVLISGGTSPYQIQWENSATTDNITNLPLGTYTVVVYDEAGCVMIDSAFVDTLPSFSITPTITHASCDGTSPGSIGVAPSGGTPPYTYSWSTGSSNAIQYNLSGGTYTVTVSDGSNCSITESYIVNSGTSLNVTVTVNGNTLEATSVAAVSYQWYFNGNLIQGATQDTYTITQSGVYWVVVTDTNGCELQSNAIETSYTNSAINELEGVNDINIYPNPSSGILYLALDITHDQKLSIKLVNMVGQVLIFETFNATAGKKLVEFDATDFANGAYFMEVNNTKSSIYKKLIINK